MNPLEHSKAGEREEGKQKYKRRMKALKNKRGEWRTKRIKGRGGEGKKTESQIGRQENMECRRKKKSDNTVAAEIVCTKSCQEKSIYYSFQSVQLQQQ